MELTESRKKIIDLLEPLESIDCNYKHAKEYRNWKYKGWGIGILVGWMQESEFDSILEKSIPVSNRIFARVHGCTLDENDNPFPKYEGKYYITSICNGLVIRYEMGEKFDVRNIYSGEAVFLTTEASQEERDACELRMYQRLFRFIDKLEEIENV